MVHRVTTIAAAKVAMALRVSTIPTHGGFYYKNPDGSSYYKSADGHSKFTPPDKLTVSRVYSGGVMLFT
ncbi:hypothetical protein NM688_g5826 [Phlebia brevispora]|uniref:Uncharacterized protein n=1 Tax=Phlebia brevispora TaxID=194682 RepID=A0ACC1SPN9_9APHY|nr:hypothetical protein NM688_g5826 [Phlebia brevispora]